MNLSITTKSIKKHLQNHPKLINSIIQNNYTEDDNPYLFDNFSSIVWTSWINNTNTFIFLYDTKKQTLIYPKKVNEYLLEKIDPIKQFLLDNNDVTEVSLAEQTHVIKIDIESDLIIISKYKLKSITKDDYNQITINWDHNDINENIWFIKTNTIKRKVINKKNAYFDVPITESIDFTNGVDSILYNYPKLSELKPYYIETTNNKLIKNAGLKVSLTYSDILKINEPRTLTLTTKYKRLNVLKDYIQFPTMTVFELLMFNKLYYRVSRSDFIEILDLFQKNKDDFYEHIDHTLNLYNGLVSTSSDYYKLLIIWFMVRCKLHHTKKINNMIYTETDASAVRVKNYINLYTKLYPKKNIDLDIASFTELKNKYYILHDQNSVYASIKSRKLKTNKSLYSNAHKNMIKIIKKNKHFKIINTPNQLIDTLGEYIQDHTVNAINLLKNVTRKNTTQLLVTTSDKSVIALLNMNNKSGTINVKQAISITDNQKYLYNYELEATIQSYLK